MSLRHCPSTQLKLGVVLNQRKIDATDRQIDKLLYELYGLTEIEIVEVNMR